MADRQNSEAPNRGLERAAENNALRTTPQLGLVGDRPDENLSIIKELNSKAANAMPTEFANGSLTIVDSKPVSTGEHGNQDVASAERRQFAPRAAVRTAGDTTVEQQRETGKIANREFSIAKDANGNPVRFSDGSGTWKAMKDGETFVNEADKDQPRFMRGIPTFDQHGNFKFKDTDFGTTRTQFKDGGSRTEFESANGERIALERNSKGMPTRIEDKSGAWNSTDGKVWRNDKGEMRSGVPSIASHGEYSFKDRSGRITETVESKQLSEARNLQREISQRFGVEITAPGVKIEQGTTNQPSTRELKALEDTLDRSKQMDMLSGKEGDKDRKPLKISFLGADAKGTQGEGFGVYGNDELELFQNSRINPEGWLGLKGVGLHELVHHEQSKMTSDDWRGKNPGPEIEGLREAFGWTYHQKFGPVMLDKSGGMWSPTSRGNHDHEGGPSTSWIWVDGTRLQKGEKHTINGAEMAERAKVRQASEYNSTPYESHAEAASLLRHVPEELAKRAPEVYKAVRDWDQTKINKAFGEGTMIRGVNGKIVQDTPENRRARREMEDRYGI
jgi:hypothetical protein